MFFIVILNEDSTLSKNCIYHKGYLLPFNRTLSNLDPYSFIIVNIIPEHSFCFKNLLLNKNYLYLYLSLY